MENEQINNAKGGKFILGVAAVAWYEFMGTALLVFAVFVHTSFYGIPMMLMMAILLTGPITGGHVNPAVTAAVAILNWREWKRNLLWVLVYWSAQVCGGITGAMLGLLAIERESALYLLPGVNFPQLHPNTINTTPAGAFFIEGLCTFIFVCVISHAKDPRLTNTLGENTLVKILTIGFTLLCVIIMAGNKTGGCFNPAVSIALSVACAVNTGDANVPVNTGSETCFTDMGWYCLSTTTGGIFAGVFALL